MSDRPYHKHLAAILHKAQGVIDHETRKDIDVGGEVVKLREWCDGSATALREQAERIAELEAENERLSGELQTGRAIVHALEAENTGLRADLQGAEQRVLKEFEAWCGKESVNVVLHPKTSGNISGVTDPHAYRRASAIAYAFRCQRAQAEGEG